MIVGIYKQTSKDPASIYAALKAAGIQCGCDLLPERCACYDGTKWCKADGGDDSIIEPTTFYFNPSTNVKSEDITKDGRWDHFGNCINVGVIIKGKPCTVVVLPVTATAVTLAQVETYL